MGIICKLSPDGGRGFKKNIMRQPNGYVILLTLLN